MKLKSMNAHALGSVAAAAMAVCALSAHAAGDDIPPLSLKLSETVSYDSNYSRTTNRGSEVISSTAVEVGLNKPYGRQNYSGNAKFAVDKHKNIKEHDNQNYDVNLGFSSGIASRWSMAASVNAAQNLGAVQNNLLSERLAKNTRTYNGAGLDVQYGVSGRWTIIGSGDVSRTDYSLASSKYQNQRQHSTGLRAQYNTTDLLSFGFGASLVKSEYPLQPLVDTVGETVDQRNLNLSTNWQVTGFSSLIAVLSYAQNKYKSDSNAKYDGFTGRLNWGYTPSGITSYTLTASRSTDSDSTATYARTGGVQEFEVPGLGTQYLPRDFTYSNVTTQLGGTMRWAPTGKLAFNTGLTWYRYDVSRTRTILGSSGTPQKTSSDYAVLSFGGDYQFSRSIASGCTYQFYKQTGESNQNVSYGNPRVAFIGNQVSCNASFKID